jgi:hypothetical protein
MIYKCAKILTISTRENILISLKQTIKGVLMTITVTIKSNYGTEMIYPVCLKAKLFADISNKKTLSRLDIAAIKSLGFEVLVQQEIKQL